MRIITTKSIQVLPRIRARAKSGMKNWRVKADAREREIDFIFYANYLQLLHGYFRPGGVVQDEENIYPDSAEDADLQLQHQTRDERAEARDEVWFCEKMETVNFALHIANLSSTREMYALLLFVLHIGLTTLTSTMKMTAAIMIAARAARGMKLKYGVRNSRAKITNTPETQILYQGYKLYLTQHSLF